MSTDYKNIKNSTMRLPGTNAARLLKLIASFSPELLNQASALINTEENISKPAFYSDSRPQKENVDTIEDLLHHLSFQELKALVKPQWFTNDYGSMAYGDFYKKAYSAYQFQIIEYTLPQAFEILKNRAEKNAQDYYEGDLMNFLHKIIESTQELNASASRQYGYYFVDKEKREKNKKEFLALWDFLTPYLKKESKPLQKKNRVFLQSKLDKVALQARLIQALYCADLNLFKEIESEVGVEKLALELKEPNEEDRSYRYENVVFPIQTLTQLDPDNISYIYHSESDLELLKYLEKNNYIEPKTAKKFYAHYQRFVLTLLDQWSKSPEENLSYQHYLNSCEKTYEVIKNKVPSLMKEAASQAPYAISLEETNSYRAQEPSSFLLDNLFNPQRAAYLPLIFSVCSTLFIKPSKEVISLNESEFKMCALICQKILSSMKDKVEKKSWNNEYKTVFEQILPMQEFDQLNKDKKSYLKKIDMSQVNTENVKTVALAALSQKIKSMPKDKVSIELEAILLNLSVNKPKLAKNNSTITQAQKYKI